MKSMSFTLETPRLAPRPVWTAVKRGLLGRCPRCGEGRMFRAYLKVNDACPVCGEELHHHRADDAPPYVTILSVGHTVLGLMLMLEFVGDTIPIWVHMIIWPSLALAMSLWLLPIVKGALVAYQWALRMHGFEDGENTLVPAAAPPRA
ncbi:MAG: DUF983 domain-containing protein [Methylobacteriaceae bacterium]|nr:DUF983 domain-containing protein [Methylobacteriaceae bacterium]